MTTWRPCTGSIFGVVLFNFCKKGSPYLPLSLGETVRILEENSGWYHGFSLKNKAVKGIFPASFVHIKETQKGTVEARVNVLVTDVTSALREWGMIWRQLYLQRDEEKFNIVKQLMMDLMDMRRQLLFGNVPGDQLKQKKQKVTSVIDTGNRILGLDLIPRDDDGNLVDSNKVGVIDLYKRHVHSSTQKKNDQTQMVSSTVTTHGLYVKLKSIVCRIGDDAEVFLTLYDAEERAFISEHFMVLWDGCRGMPQDIEKFDKMSVVFTDLGSKDMDRTRIYIVCQVVRVGRMDVKDPDTNRFTHNLRRPYGVAVYNIDDIIRGRVDNDAVRETYAKLLPIEGDNFLEAWIEKQIKRPETKSQATQGTVWFEVRLLHGEMDQIREDYPLLVNRETVVARKLGFPEVIMPGDVRNDLYINITTGDFDRGEKRSSKNIEVSMCVCSEEGKTLPEVICYGAGQEARNAYRSNIYYHCGNSRWFETVKLSIPINKFFNSHVRFTFKHRSSKEDKDKSQRIFAVCFIKLMHKDGTTLFDSVHDLFVYKCDLKEIKEKDVKLYLQLPSSMQESSFSATPSTRALSKGPFTLSQREKFQIKTLLCSTKLTQNADLLSLLKWKEQKERLTSILPTVMKVSGEEIVKFLQGIFDVLFAILNEDPLKYGRLVFDCLVFTIGLLADNKFQHFRPVLDTYIASLFHAAKAHTTLISVLRSYVDFANEADLDKIRLDLLLKAMKALEYIIKYIVRSRELFELTAQGKGIEEFQNDLRSLFKAMIKMMSNDKNETLLVQGAALKYLPTIFTDVMKVFDAQELGEFTRDFILKIPEKRLSSQKMTCVHQIVRSKLFQNENSRGILLPMILQQLNRNIEKNEEHKPCSEILCDILAVLDRKDLGVTHQHIQLLVDSLFTGIVQTVILMDRTNPLAGVYVSSLIAILKLMDQHHYRNYIGQFKRNSLIEFLTRLFLVFRELVSNCVYPGEWMIMIMVQNSVILTAIRFFCRALSDQFLVEESFEYQLWNNFFHLAVAFITQDSLQLQLFSDAKRNKILDKYGDMRVAIGSKIKEMWLALGKHKTRFIPELVGPFLEVTLIPEHDLRKSTIPIFFDMISVEYKNHGHFQKVENEVITKLDVLVEGGRGDEEYKELFQQIMQENFRTQPALEQKGFDFVETVSGLLERLLDYRHVISRDENIDNHMSCTVNLLNFYKDIRREEMYIRYLYKLRELHLTVENYTEAAFTLLLHTDLLKWSDEPVEITSNQSGYQATTQRQLKELLYTDVIDYFDKGKTWEYGIKYCKELARQYENETFDYIKLSQILIKEAKFFDNIITQLRAEPEYFRVGFYGEGFPKFLRNKVFVFRGKEYERLADFNMRMQAQFVNAQIMKKLGEPGEKITKSNGQYLQICTVDAVPVKLRKFQGKNVMEQILMFYNVNDIRTFQFSRPFHKEPRDKECEFSSLWIERTKMDTKYTLPGILRWFEVENSTKIEICPLENALETVAEKNHEIRILIGQYKSDANKVINPLSMVLNGVIDAAVQGGTANYEKIFFVPPYIKEHPDHADYIQILKEYMIEQVYILDECVAIHANRITEALRPFHENIEKRFKEMRTKILGSYAKNSQVTRTQSLPRTISDHPRISTRRKSSVEDHIPEERISSAQKRVTPYSDDLPAQELHRTRTIVEIGIPNLPIKNRQSRSSTVSGAVDVGSLSPTRHSHIPPPSDGRLLASSPEEPEDEDAPAKPPRNSSTLPAPRQSSTLPSTSMMIPETPPKGSATLPAGTAPPPLPERQRPSSVSDRSSSGSSLSNGSVEHDEAKPQQEQSPVLPPRHSTTVPPNSSQLQEQTEPVPDLPARK